MSKVIAEILDGKPAGQALATSNDIFEARKAKFIQVMDAAFYEATKRQKGGVLKGNPFIECYYENLPFISPFAETFHIEPNPTNAVGKNNVYMEDYAEKIAEVLKEWGVPLVRSEAKGTMGRLPDGTRVFDHILHFNREALETIDAVYRKADVQAAIIERARAFARDSYDKYPSQQEILSKDVQASVARLVPVDPDTGKPLDTAFARSILDNVTRAANGLASQWGLAIIGQGKF